MLNQFRRILAHHEAAHIIFAHDLGAGINDAGIDLDRPSSVAGAFGGASVNVFVQDLSAPARVQQDILIENLMIIYAGAASDAKLKNISFEMSLAAQNGPNGDKARADLQLRAYTSDEAEWPFASAAAARRTVEKINKAETWSRIVALADAAIANGGKLSKIKIEATLDALGFSKDCDTRQ